MAVSDLRNLDPRAHEALVELEATAREVVAADAAAGTIRRYCWGATVVHRDGSEECSRGPACSILPHLALTACTVFAACSHCL